MSMVLVTLGLGRLGFSALMPVLLSDHWASVHSAGYIGTAISAGAFIGFFICHPLSIRLGQERLIRITLIVAVVVLGAEIWLPGHEPGSKTPPHMDSIGFWWLMSLRFICGVAAVLGFMLGPAYIAKLVKAENRTGSIGLAVAGAGIGAIIVSLLMPFAIKIPSIPPAQGGMILTTILAVIFTIIAWPAFTVTKADAIAAAAAKPEPAIGRIIHLPFILMAVGLIFLLVGTMPIILFASAYIHVDRHFSVATASMTIAAVGVGAAIGGPFFNTLLARFLNLRITSVISAAMGILACIPLIFDLSIQLVVVSVGVIGLVTFGHAGIASARCLELTGPEGHLKTWTYCGIGMGLGSVAGTFVSSAMLQAGLGFHNIFIMCAGALLILLITHGLAKTAHC